MAGVEPDEVRPYAGGGRVVVYSGVSYDSFEDFMRYMKDLGYETTAEIASAVAVEQKLTNGEFNIGVVCTTIGICR